MALDEPQENEKPVQINGMDVLISEFHMPYFEDVTVDYIMEASNEGFTITGSGNSC